MKKYKLKLRWTCSDYVHMEMVCAVVWENSTKEKKG